MKKRLSVNTVILVFLFLLAGTLNAQLRLPKIFGDSMVLQRNAPLKIWGWASPGETIRVRFHNQQRIAQTGANGNWQTVLNPEPVGGPYFLQVQGNTTITLRGILMGDYLGMFRPIEYGNAVERLGTGAELGAGDRNGKLSRHPPIYG